MKPDAQAIQVFYGTVPLILVILGVWFREQMLLKDILARLGRLEESVAAAGVELGRIRERLITLETRAGVIYRGN